MVPFGRPVNLVLAVVAVASGIVYIAGFGGVPILVLLSACALALGVLSTLPIGGADMPVVISLLNAFTGTAVAMAGFVINSTPLIIAGALVGAAGGILTKLMADAMNRSLVSIIAGGFGTGDSVTAGPMDAGSGTVREITVDDAALQLAYAGRVVIVPGYGLAAAQAQHEIVKLAQTLVNHGIDVEFAIHPVAGRMPGHMNVLLAEANAPVRTDEGHGRGEPAVQPYRRGAGRRRERCHQSGRAQARQLGVRHAHPERRRGQERHRHQAVDGSRLRRASTTSCTPTRRPRCCSATPRSR